jgi:ribosomal protein S18 acetylase RimI-like enzyme
MTQTIEELKNEFTYKVILKIEIEGKIVGSVRGWEKGNTCFVGRLIVHPDFQGQGIGTALMDQIELFFTQVQRFELFAGHKSERNIHFYERLGYKIFKNQEINKNLIFMFMEKQK